MIYDKNMKPIKSANYNGFNLEARRSYGKGNGYFTTYPVWDTDLDTSIGAIEYHYAVENPYYVAWVYDDFGANKTGRTKDFDTEEECLEWIGEELASGTTARDKLLKYWEELGYDYKSKNLNNSRKPVKSDWKREAEFMNDRIRDDNLLYQVFKIEDEHFGGNFENPDNWDGTHIVYTIENGEITNTEIVDSFEDVIDDGNKYYLSANRDTGYRNTDYVLDRVALWQERNNRGITSSRKPIKSSAAPDGLTFDSREDEDGYKFIQYKITDQSRLDKIKGYCDHNEDELQLGKTFLNLMYDESDKLLAAQLVDTDSSTWEVSPEECVEVFGSSIETLSDPSVGKHAVDEFMDYDVDPVQSARRTIKSGKKYNVIDKNGGVVGQPKSYEDACDEAEEIGGTVKPVESSRKSVKSGLDFVQKGEVILAKKGTKVVGYIGQNADKEFYYGLGTPGKSSGVMVVSDFNSATKRLEEQSRQ